jgi:hypothetical protein
VVGSADLLHDDRELHPAAVVDWASRTLSSRVSAAVSSRKTPAVLLDHPVARLGLLGGDDVQGGGVDGILLIRSPASWAPPDWSTIVLTTVLAFSVRVGTRCFSFC